VQAIQQELEIAAKQPVLEIPGLQRRAPAKSLHYYRAAFDNAKIGMPAAYATGDYTMQAIADAFGVHYAAVSRAVSGNGMLDCKT
jgi:putative transposase